MKTAIITAGDAPYFPMIMDLVASIHRHRPDAALDICILDVGLTPEQRAQLAPSIAKFVEPRWDIDFPNRHICAQARRAQVCRPFYPQYFPEYDRYIHLDADLWLQDWRAIDMLLLASQKPSIVIVPELHAAYLHTFDPAGLDFRRAMFQTCIGEAGLRYAAAPILNTGVWAMQRAVPFWDEWATVLRTALQRGLEHMSEQCALNFAVYSGKIPFYPLPAWCNWICGMAMPVFDPAQRIFYEPLLPHEPISILHLTGAKDVKLSVQCTDGSMRQMWITYSAIHTPK